MDGTVTSNASAFSGFHISPRLRRSHPPSEEAINDDAFPGHVCDGVTECVKYARDKLYCGADFIKIMGGRRVASPSDRLQNINARSKGPFRPRAVHKGTTNYQLRQFAEATLGSGSLRKAVKLPEGEDLNEWLAVNVVDFYNQINLLYGSITEFCSPQSCPEMKATDEFEYLWQDSENYKRPTKMPAPQYVEHLMAWVQSNIDNEQMFPSRIGVPFPKTFTSLLRQLFKRLYRVYAHIYCHHYPVIVHLGLEPHLNTSFKHYVLFVDEHSLASGKDFWGPLGDLVESMLRSD
ncbi:hypothetical protein ACO22_01795 [Paracoccidioides brasiliensis]|uniref:Maintenance of ploidy protein mob1 n=1 Tax=Paracoccidioides brasiliensis TaxID=121759 RepID=A0A1D2JKN1_PARBR|nr:hypothetical protein ACO22_01795 [Paracoccidioides brasiliensis]